MTQSPDTHAKGMLPFHKVTTAIETKAAVEQAVAALLEAGFENDKILVHHGEQAEHYFDFDGSESNFIQKAVRGYQRMGVLERRLFDGAEAAIEAGQYLIGVSVGSDEEKQMHARDCLVPYAIQDIYYCGRFSITVLAFAKTD